MEISRDIKKRILNKIEKEFKFVKYKIPSEENPSGVEIYVRENAKFVLCVNFTNLSSYINGNRNIHNFFVSKGIKYSLVNVFIVFTIDEIENTYFQTEFYEEAIFIEELSGRIKSFNVHSVGFLNILKDVVEGNKQKSEKGKNNHITIFLISISILAYFILGSISGDIVSIRDDVLLWAGGKMDILIKAGEYNRIFMSPFLHKNFVQLIVGVITLFFTGSIVEKNISKIKYVILIILSILIGNFTSYVFNFSNVFGVGLYVINYGMIGALFILAFKYRNKVNKLFFIFIFSFIGINILNSMFLTNIDNFGSLASFVFGIIYMKVLDLFKN